MLFLRFGTSSVVELFIPEERDFGGWFLLKIIQLLHLLKAMLRSLFVFGTGGKWGFEPFGNYSTFCNKSLILTKLLKYFASIKVSQSGRQPLFQRWN